MIAPLVLLSCLLATALASQPITLLNVLDGLKPEGLAQYKKLSLQQQEAAILELQTLSIDLQDAKSVRFSATGKIYIVDDGLDDTLLAAIRNRRGNRDRRAISDLSATSFDSQGIPLLSSKPGAINTLYLDFNGHTTTSSSAWGAFSAEAFSLDSNRNSFNTAEKAFIENVWRRVTEDYAPFQYDVTTIEPTTFGSRTTRCLITSSTQVGGADMPAVDAGGVAYLNVFGISDYQEYSPALVYYDNLGSEEDFVAEAASHEVGHNLGLSHDGRDFPGTNNDEEYYQGERDESDPISWGPIMGTGYRNSISQWSKGEYPDASNTQDDLAIMTGKLGTEVDEAGDTTATARLLTLSNNQVSFSGIIATTQDLDFFRINVPSAGTLALTANPWFSTENTKGNNLDIDLQVFNSAGTLIGSHSPSDVATASVTVNVVAGDNYIRLDGVAGGIYTDYGSIGQYNLEAVFAAGNTVTTTQPSTATTTTTTSAAGCQNDDLESNDSVSSATSVATLPYSNTLSICSGDMDVFVVNICAGGAVEVVASFDHSDGDIDMDLIIDGAVRSRSDSATDNEALTVQNTGANDGLVYFAVYGYNGVSNPSYTINIAQSQSCNADDTTTTTTTTEATTTTTTTTEATTTTTTTTEEATTTTSAANCAADAFEPNNNAASASYLSLPAMAPATFCADDIDFYTVTLCPNAIVQAFLAFEHDDADLELDLEVNGVIRGRSSSSNDNEVLSVRNTGSQPVDIEFVVWASSGHSLPYTLNVTQTSGVDCLATTLAPTTTTSAATTTFKATSTADTTVITTVATSTSTSSELEDTCTCTGTVRSFNSRNRNFNIRFRSTCSQGHRFRFCLERDDDRAGTITAEFQRKVSGSYQVFQAAQDLGPNDGDRLCYAVDLPASMTTRNQRYRLRVSNSNRRRYTIQTGTTGVRANDCDPLL